MKTYKEILEPVLSKEDMEEVERKIDEYARNVKWEDKKNPSVVLISSLIFRNTEKGHSYWWHLKNKLNNKYYEKV